MSKNKNIIMDKINKKFIIISLVILCMSVFLVTIYRYKILSVVTQNEEVIINNKSEIPVGEITAGVVIEQLFVSNEEDFIGISLCLATYARQNKGLLYVDLIDVDLEERVNQWKIDVSHLTDNTYNQFLLEKPISDSKGKVFNIAIHADETAQSGNAVTIWAANSDNYSEGSLYRNNVLQDADLAFKLLFRSNRYSFISNVFITYTIFALIFLSLSAWLLLYKKISIEKYFIIAMLFFGVIYMLVLPPFSAPDEPRHYVTAYKNSNQILLKKATDENGFAMIRENDDGLYKTKVDLNTYLTVKETLFKLDSSTKDVSFDWATVINTSFIAHFPQSLGITLARLLSLGQTQLLFMGRLFNLLFYTLLVYIAIKKIPFGKMILLSISMLPMMLELASSFSYDTVIVALAFLFIAYCLELIYEKDKIEKKDIVILSVIIACLAPIKVVYFMLVLLCVLFPKNKFTNKNKYYIAVGSLLGIAILSMFLNNINVISEKAQETKLIWIDLPSYSLSALLQDPIHTIKIFYNTFNTKLEMYLKTMLGSSLAWLDIGIPFWIIFGFGIVLILSALKIRNEKTFVCYKERLFISFIIITTSGLVLLSMLVSWTPITYSVIEGVQGRYFLPLLPLILILLKTKHIQMENNIDRYLAFSLSLFNVIVVLEVFVKVCLRQ